MSYQFNRSVREDSALSRTQKLAMLVLVSYADKEGKCFPSLNTLSRDMHLSVRGAINILVQLQSMNRIVKLRQGGGRLSNLYQIVNFTAPLKPVHSSTEVTSAPTFNKNHITNHITNNTHYAHAPTRAIDGISESLEPSECDNQAFVEAMESKAEGVECENGSPGRTRTADQVINSPQCPGAGLEELQSNKNAGETQVAKNRSPELFEAHPSTILAPTPSNAPQSENLAPCSETKRVYDNHGSAFSKRWGCKTPDDEIDPQFEEYKNIFPRREKLEAMELKILWRGLTAEEKKLALADVKHSSGPGGRWEDLIKSKRFHMIPMPDNYLQDERWKDEWHLRIPQNEKDCGTAAGPVRIKTEHKLPDNLGPEVQPKFDAMIELITGKFGTAFVYKYKNWSDWIEIAKKFDVETIELATERLTVERDWKKDVIFPLPSELEKLCQNQVELVKTASYKKAFESQCSEASKIVENLSESKRNDVIKEVVNLFMEEQKAGHIRAVPGIDPYEMFRVEHILSKYGGNHASA